MKKIKMLVSCLLAIMLLAVSVVPAFAETDAELNDAVNELKKYADDCEYEYIYYFKLTPPVMPEWSDKSTQVMKDAISDVRTTTYTSISQVDKKYILLNDSIDNLRIHSRGLEWLINYTKKDYDSTGYYDESTYVALKEIYENAQSALDSKDDTTIHTAYVQMRNELDEICSYNMVPGDVDQDGTFNIIDVTLMQQYLAKAVHFTNSQRYVANADSYFSIEKITQWQKSLAKIVDDRPNNRILEVVSENLTQLDKYKGNITVDLRKYYYTFPNTSISYESANALYFNDLYNCNPMLR